MRTHTDFCMDLNKLGQITETSVLYTEYLHQFNTEWLQIQRLDRVNSRTPLPKLTAQQSMLRVWRHNLAFHFSLHIATEPNVAYTYEFYPESAGTNVPPMVNRARSDLTALSPSALYVCRAAQQLSLYTEPIDRYALHHLDGVMHGDDDASTGDRTHLTPQLFYQNLVKLVEAVAGATDLISVVAPGRHANHFRSNIQCTVRPVYGPSHQPLHVTLHSGLYYRIFLGVVPPEEEEEETGDVVHTLAIGTESSGANVTYDIMAVVEALARLLVSAGGGGAEDALKELMASYRPDDNRLGRLYSQRVSAVMDPGVLYAFKLAQLALDDESSDIRQATKAKELHASVERAYAKAGVTDTAVPLARTLYRLIGDVKSITGVSPK